MNMDNYIKADNLRSERAEKNENLENIRVDSSMLFNKKEETEVPANT